MTHWVTALAERPRFEPGDDVAAGVAGVLGVVAPVVAEPLHIASRVVDDVLLESLAWETGIGPLTRAWLARPLHQEGDLPGVLALHSHSGAMWTGADQFVAAELPDADPYAAALGRAQYGGAPVLELARRGFVVLAHDAFAWGSRRLPLESFPPRERELAAALGTHRTTHGGTWSPVEEYNTAAQLHEHVVQKAAALVGSSFAGIVSTDDLVALEQLSRLPGVDAERLGAFGFSGGGGRAVFLSALDPRLRAVAVVAMMCTWRALAVGHASAHSWLINVPGLAALADLPDLPRLGGGHALLAQYREDDDLFPLAGMRAAHERLRTRDVDGSYEGAFFPGPHAFGPEMQAEAWGFLERRLR